MRKGFNELSIDDGILGAWDWKYQEVIIEIGNNDQLPFTKLIEENKELHEFFSTPVENIKKIENKHLAEYPTDNPIDKYLNNDYSFWDKLRYFLHNFKIYNG